MHNSQVEFILILLSLATAEKTCNIRTFGAVGNNITDDSHAIQTAIESCHLSSPQGAIVLFPGPATYRINVSLHLTSNITLLLAENTSIFFSRTPDMPVVQDSACPTLYWPHGGTAIVCGTNISNIALIGSDMESSVIDGGGWSWYLRGEQNSSWWGKGPRLFEVAWSKNITLRNLTLRNSPSWTVHPTFSDGILAERIRIINPRFTPNTDGFDPDSCTNVVLRDSFIDTGDDGISIKSSNSSYNHRLPMPTRNVLIQRTTILSRNICVGSATFGGVYDVIVEDCIVGDDNGSSPWAIKYKSHRYYPGTMQNHTYRRLRIGKIAPNQYQQPHGGTAIIVGLTYGNKPPTIRPPCPPMCPIFKNVVFENITIKGALKAGNIIGLPEDKLNGLHFKNVSFLEEPKSGWNCKFVQSYSAENVSPPLKCSN